MVEKKYIKPSTINRELACLKCLFNKAIEWGYAKENPVRKIKLFKEDNSRIRYLEKEEIDDLLNACDSLKSAIYLKPIIIVALNIGMRLMEILGMKWKNIDFKNSLLYIETSKNGEGAYIPMNTTVKELMRHKSIEMTLRYSHLSLNHKSMAVENIYRNEDGTKAV